MLNTIMNFIWCQNSILNFKIDLRSRGSDFMKFPTDELCFTASSTFKTGCSRQKDSESTCNGPYAYEI